MYLVILALDKLFHDCMNVCICMYVCMLYTGCIKKIDKSEIALCFAKRLNVQCFFIKIDCFGTYNLKKNEKVRSSIMKTLIPGGGLCPLRQVKYALRAKRKCLKVILNW